MDADFAVILYGGDPTEIQSLCAFSTRKDAVIHCKRSQITFSSEHSTFPKPLLYQDLLNYLPEYSKTMLIDEDISMKDVNMTDFLLTWKCAFYPQSPPLVVQGLIYEPSQAYSFLHHGTWRAENLSSVLATETNFIEQQIPAFDSIYLLWFIESVISNILEDSLKYESDWGADNFWCAAAKDFAAAHWQYRENFVPCALLTQTPPFHHLNSHAIAGKRQTYRTYKQYGRKMMAVWRHFFPSWYADIADPTQADLPVRRVRSLPYECVEKERRAP